jgi:hypothetical protein
MKTEIGVFSFTEAGGTPARLGQPRAPLRSEITTGHDRPPLHTSEPHGLQTSRSEITAGHVTHLPCGEDTRIHTTANKHGSEVTTGHDRSPVLSREPHGIRALSSEVAAGHDGPPLHTSEPEHIRTSRSEITAGHERHLQSTLALTASSYARTPSVLAYAKHLVRWDDTGYRKRTAYERTSTSSIRLPIPAA